MAQGLDEPREPYDDEDALEEPYDELASEPAEAPRVKPSSAAEAATSIRDAIKSTPKVDPTFISAPPPFPLHTVSFPVYDRAAKGYRIITRAFGTPELKVQVKVLLDALLTGDPAAAVEPAMNLAIEAPAQAPTRLGEGHIGRRWQCRHYGSNHDARFLTDPTIKNNPGRMHDHAENLASGINSCMNEFYRMRDRGIRSPLTGDVAISRYDRFAPNSVHYTEEAWAFYEDHAPFMSFNYGEGYWQALVAGNIVPDPVVRDVSSAVF